MSKISDKGRAHDLGYEWILNSDGYVCMRLMHFDDEGKRVVRYTPDPSEFVPYWAAMERLKYLESKKETEHK